MRKLGYLISVCILASAGPVHSQSFGEDCRSFAKAIHAVAESRDNLDEPSWEKLHTLPPILEKVKKMNGRGYTYAQGIHLRVMNKSASPRALMNNFYENCLSTTGLCMLYNQGCGSK